MFASRASKVGLGIIVVLVAFIIGGMFFSGFSPSSASGSLNLPPGTIHLFGTDYLGHDLFSQVAWGSIPSLAIAVIASLGSVLIAHHVGVTSRYYETSQIGLDWVTD